MRSSKENVEKLCRLLGMAPAERFDLDHGIVFIADSGTLLFNQRDYKTPHYKTMWFVASEDDRVDYGPVLYFDWNHDDNENWTSETKRRARINRARAEAAGFMRSRQGVRYDA